MNVLPKLAILRHIPHTPIIETVFPYLALKAEFLLGSKGKPSFDELHGFLNCVGSSQQQVNMIRHDDKLMEQVFPLIAIAEQNIQEQPCHLVGLEHGHFLVAGGGEEVTA